MKNNATDIKESLCLAINEIVQKSISEASFDKTYTAMIVACVDEAKGKYKIKYQDSYYYATTDNAGVKYPNKTEVYILVPGNDFSKNKKIVGTVKDLGDAYLDNDFIQTAYDEIGENCFNSIETFAFSADNCPIYEVLYDKNDIQNSKIQVDENHLKEYMSKATHFRMGASFKTDFEKEQRDYGNYGIIVKVDFIDKENYNIKTNTYVLDVPSMSGTPYTFFTFSKQNNVYDLNGEQYVGINEIAFFAEKIPSKNLVISEPNMWIKDFTFSALGLLYESSYEAYRLSIESPKGLIFDKNISEITLNAKPVFKNKTLDDSKVQFFWFVEHAGITSNHFLYNSHGGEGWKCLNKYYVTKSSQVDGVSIPEEITWAPGSSTLVVHKDDIPSKQSKYKCVCLYQDSISFEKEIDVLNKASKYLIKIESSNGTDFLQGRGATNLTCQAFNTAVSTVTPLKNVYYVWSKTVNGKTQILNENLNIPSIIKNIPNEELYNRFYHLIRSFEFGFKEGMLYRDDEVDFNSKRLQSKLEYKSFSAEDMLRKIYNFLNLQSGVTNNEFYNSVVNYYNNNYFPFKKNGVLFNLPAKNLSKNEIYSCSVYRQNESENKEIFDDHFLGSISITLNNENGGVQSHQLTILNGNQVFKYDAEGLSPAHSKLNHPQIIDALSFEMTDEKGYKLTDVTIEQECQVTWKLPVDSEENRSLLRFPNIVDDKTEQKDNYYLLDGKKVKILPFQIKDKYSAKYANNTIILEVKYQNKVYSAQTNFTFVKDGASGTNGTSFYCKIVPTQGDLKGYPTFNYSNNTCYANFTSGAIPRGKWFKAELWNGGDLLPESELTEIRWKMMRNKTRVQNPDKTFSYPLDFTNFNIEGETDTVYSDGLLESEIDSYSIVLEEGQENPSNILQVAVTHKAKRYYGTLPLVFATIKKEGERLKGEDFRLSFKANSGFSEVLYASDGSNPTYSSLFPFEVEVFRKTSSNGEWENITDYLSKDGFDKDKYNFPLSFKWSVVGSNSMLKMLEDKDETLQPNQARFEPVKNYDGYTLNAGIKCKVSDKKGLIGEIHFPIHFFLNRYGLASINGWNGNQIEINEEDGYILAPQIGAGKKEKDNSFTGMVMGEVRDHTGVSETGLFGYTKGRRSIFLDAESGAAFFGVNKEIQLLPDGDETSAIFGPWNLTNESIWRENKELGGSAWKYLESVQSMENNSQENPDDLIIKIASKMPPEIFEAARGEVYLGIDGFSLGGRLKFDTKTGKLYVIGRIYAENLTAEKVGDFGPWNMDNDSMSMGIDSFGAPGKGNLYFGIQGLSISDRFLVDSSGYLTAKDVNIRSGSLGSWLIGSTSLYQGTNSFKGNGDGNIYLGEEGFSITNKFAVNRRGIFEGTLGGLTVKPNYLLNIGDTQYLTGASNKLLEQDIENFKVTDYYNFFKELKPILFKYKNKTLSHKNLGYSAEDLEKLLKKYPSISENLGLLATVNNIKAIDYNNFNMLYAVVLQKLIEQVEKSSSDSSSSSETLALRILKLEEENKEMSDLIKELTEKNKKLEENDVILNKQYEDLKAIVDNL